MKFTINSPWLTTFRISALSAASIISAFAGCPTLSAPPKPSTPYTLNVQDFGAVGDGVTDDRPAIQNALNCAQQLRYANVMFSAKTYRLVSSTAGEAQLFLANWSGGPMGNPIISLFGVNTVFLTEQVNSAILKFGGYWMNGIIQGITFRNNHSITNQITIGLSLEGGGQNGITNWTIQNCIFNNFSRGLEISGITGALIQNNRFLMDKGRDSGTSSNTIQPNVGIWLFNNYPNGNSVNVEVAGNFYDGCAAGTLSGSASGYCGDGFFFGQVDHALVHNNHVQRFSFEGIFLSRNQGPGGGGAPSVIDHNTIDATKVVGDINGGGLWGIRCDDDGAVITSNTITNATYGIWVYPTDLTHPIVGTVIKNNSVYLSGTAQPGIGIYLLFVANAVVDSNLVIFPQNIDTKGPETIGLYVSGVSQYSQSVTPAVTGNSIIAYGGGSSGRTTAVFLQWVQQCNVSRNTFHGFSQAFHFMNFGPALPPVSQFLQTNVLSANVASYKTTN